MKKFVFILVITVLALSSVSTAFAVKPSTSPSPVNSTISSSSAIKTTTTIVPQKPAFTMKEGMAFTIRVRDVNGNPINNANVKVTVMAPNGKTSSYTAVTGGMGNVALGFTLNSIKKKGVYRVIANTAATDIYAHSSGTCSVERKNNK